MAECKNFHRCSFFTIDPEDQSQEIALAGFKRIYCTGPKQDQCMRRIVAKELGPEFLPMNMMPNGMPLRGSKDSEWSEELKAFVRKNMSKE